VLLLANQTKMWGCGSHNDHSFPNLTGIGLPPDKPALKTLSSSMPKRRMRRTLPQRAIGILASLLLASL
jgi:hypothetical protein